MRNVIIICNNKLLDYRNRIWTTYYIGLRKMLDSLTFANVSWLIGLLKQQQNQPLVVVLAEFLHVEL